MFDAIIAKVVLGWIRTGVAASAGGLVAHGYLTSSENQQFVGAVMTLVPLMFSAYDKWHAEQSKNAAILAASKSEK